MPEKVRSAKLSIRLRPRERRLLEIAAEQHGVHLSELVRNASVQEARRELNRLRNDVRPGTSGADE